MWSESEVVTSNGSEARLPVLESGLLLLLAVGTSSNYLAFLGYVLVIPTTKDWSKIKFFNKLLEQCLACSRCAVLLSPCLSSK